MEIGEELRDLLMPELRAPRGVGAGAGLAGRARGAGGRDSIAIGPGGANHLDQLLDRDALEENKLNNY